MNYFNRFRLILDVRTPTEIIKYGRIPNSKNIEYEELVTSLKKYITPLVTKKDPVLVYCQSGKRSRHITWLGRHYGYNFNDLEGGFENFVKKN